MKEKLIKIRKDIDNLMIDYDEKLISYIRYEFKDIIKLLESIGFKDNFHTLFEFKGIRYHLLYNYYNYVFSIDYNYTSNSFHIVLDYYKDSNITFVENLSLHESFDETINKLKSKIFEQYNFFFREQKLKRILN